MVAETETGSEGQNFIVSVAPLLYTHAVLYMGCSYGG